ncbi:MAG: nitronate monooxygenase, partial [Methylotenera sp.]
ANIGMPQVRASGYVEQALVTLGSDLSGEEALLAIYPNGWSALEAVRFLSAPDGS